MFPSLTLQSVFCVTTHPMCSLWPGFPVLTSGRRGGVGLRACSRRRNANHDRHCVVTLWAGAAAHDVEACDAAPKVKAELQTHSSALTRAFTLEGSRPHKQNTDELLLQSHRAWKRDVVSKCPHVWKGKETIMKSCTRRKYADYQSTHSEQLVCWW